MNKLNAHAPSFTNVPATELNASIQRVDLERPRRLIVLIPPGSDCTSLTRRICRLAVETHSDIQLLGLCKDHNQELMLRRELVIVSALIRDAKVFVDIKIEVGTDWLGAIKRDYQDGDMLVCIVEQAIGMRRRPLSEILESTFKAPIYVLTETKPTQPQSNVLSQVLGWAGILAIMAGFFLLEMKIAQLPDDWFQTLLSILVLLPELGLIWLWNSLF
jgi:hypothetical protein